MSSAQELLARDPGAAANVPMSSTHQSLETDKLVSSSQRSLDRGLGATTNKLPLTSHQAANAVLSTNELLCDIVACLPFRDMVSVTGVCKSWRGALKEDHRIQQALFLEPAKVSEVLCENHLLNNLERTISIDDCVVVSKLHPRTLKIYGEVSVVRVGLWHLGRFPHFDHPNGAWRDMFLTQPPCKTIQVKSNKQRETKQITYENSRGVTLGELYDLIHSKTPDYRQYTGGWVIIPGYADEDNMQFSKRFTSRCKVRAGQICRPAKLPLRVASSDDPDDSQCADDYVGSVTNHDLDGLEYYDDGESDDDSEDDDDDY